MNSKQLLLVFFMLLSVNFFGLVALLPLRDFISLVCDVVFFFFLFTQFENLWKLQPGRYLCLYLIFFLISCCYGLFIKDQRLTSMTVGINPYLGLVTFAICLGSGFSSDEVRKVLLTVSVIFCLCYIGQWLLYPNIIFKGAEDERWDEYYFRMRLPLSLCGFYLFLTGVNDIFQSKLVRALIFMIMGGIPIIVVGFRSLTVLTLFSVLVLIILRKQKSFKFVIGFLLTISILFALSQTDLFVNKLDEMVKRQARGDIFSNPNYIRWVTLNYFINYVDNWQEWLFGMGIPCGNSAFPAQIRSLTDDGIYWQDLGLIGLSFFIGIATVLILFTWTIREIARCAHIDLCVERLTIFIALAGSIITTMEFYRSGNFMILGLMFYREYIKNKELGAPQNKFILRKEDYSIDGNER